MKLQLVIICILNMFSDMQNVHQVLITFIQGAVEIPDPQVRLRVKISVNKDK